TRFTPTLWIRKLLLRQLRFWGIGHGSEEANVAANLYCSCRVYRVRKRCTEDSKVRRFPSTRSSAALLVHPVSSSDCAHRETATVRCDACPFLVRNPDVRSGTGTARNVTSLGRWRRWMEVPHL